MSGIKFMAHSDIENIINELDIVLF